MVNGIVKQSYAQVEWFNVQGSGAQRFKVQRFKGSEVERFRG
jgi:hypothetical protein